jgi:hypothetical protein
MNGRELNIKTSTKQFLILAIVLGLAITAFFTNGCKKAFTPAVTGNNANILVVEG